MSAEIDSAISRAEHDACAAARSAEAMRAHLSSLTLVVSAPAAPAPAVASAGFSTANSEPLLASPAAAAERALSGEGDELSQASYRAALVRTGVVMGCSLALGVAILLVRGRELGLQFFAGYLIEQSLSVDNLFVFKLIFSSFGVSGAAERRCLAYGIWAAAVLRLGMIVAGIGIMELFRPVLLLFAAILILTAISVLRDAFSGADAGGASEAPADNAIIRLCSRLVRTTAALDGDRFFTTATADGKWRATPLLLALVCIEVSDVVFAVDSVPAVLAVTHDRAIAFTSNMCAIGALRALYAVLSQLVSQFELLQPAVALVLGFVGGKMAAEFFGAVVPITISLAVIVAVLAAGVGASVCAARLRTRAAEARREEAVAVAAEGGALRAPRALTRALTRRPASRVAESVLRFPAGIVRLLCPGLIRARSASRALAPRDGEGRCAPAGPARGPAPALQ
ncbi:hypothetical protein KFE25_012198 [Diacronema lutheri]|uniref:Tellurium resistance protein TerC n=2 Tax=Diacronema lutheri TaxID=2081491 RepID=A0A8J5X9J8_DIALT|nr:hypothetical protein KFE25_012198 [Diacronema lutheri]